MPPKQLKLRIDTSTIPDCTGSTSNTSSPTSTVQACSPTVFKNLQRSAEFYLQCGDLHLLVEGAHLFRVHSFFFQRDSPTFRDMLAAPASGQRPGSADSAAILLDTTKSNFEKFLFIFYNPSFTIYDFSIDDWVGILDQAHRWGFQNVKELALRELARLDMPDVDRVALYEKYEVESSFLIPLYANLCDREEVLSQRESLVLGLRTAVRIFQGREKLRAFTFNKGQRTRSDAEKLARALLRHLPEKNGAHVTNDGKEGLVDPPIPTASIGRAV